MNASRVGVLLIGSFLLLPGLLRTRTTNRGFPHVTLDNLKKNPDKYQGQVVQIEGTLRIKSSGIVEDPSPSVLHAHC